MDSSLTMENQLLELTTLPHDLIELIVVYASRSRDDLKNLPIGTFTFVLNMKIVPDANIPEESYYHRSKVEVELCYDRLFTFTFVKNKEICTLHEGFLYNDKLMFNIGCSTLPYTRVLFREY